MRVVNLMQYILAIVMGLNTLFFKKSKIFFCLFLLFLWLLASFNYTIADKENYYSKYLQAGYYNGVGEGEIGFLISLKIGNFLGFDFSVYLAIYFLVGLLLISRFIMKYSDNIGYVVVLYFIYPFIIDVAQIRNFMAMAIILNAIPYLASIKKIDTIKYLLLLILAVSFHYSSVFYLIFLLVKIPNIKKLVVIVTFITTIGSVLSYVLPNLLSSIFPFLEIQFNRYTQSSVSLYTAIGMLAYLITSLIIVYISWEKLRKNKEIEKKIDSKLLDVILKINITVLILYPFLLYAYEFNRIHRNILLVNYILFSHVITVYKGRLLQSYIFRIIIITFVLLSFYYFIFYQFSDQVFFPFFEKNYIFN